MRACEWNLRSRSDECDARSAIRSAQAILCGNLPLVAPEHTIQIHVQAVAQSIAVIAHLARFVIETLDTGLGLDVLPVCYFT